MRVLYKRKKREKNQSDFCAPTSVAYSPADFFHPPKKSVLTSRVLKMKIMTLRMFIKMKTGTVTKGKLGSLIKSQQW